MWDIDSNSGFKKKKKKKIRVPAAGWALRSAIFGARAAAVWNLFIHGIKVGGRRDGGWGVTAEGMLGRERKKVSIRFCLFHLSLTIAMLVVLGEVKIS